MALPARAVVTHLGEVAELAEEGGLHCDVRGRDAAEQVEHRLEDGVRVRVRVRVREG